MTSFKCHQISLNSLSKRQKYSDMRKRHPPVYAVWKNKTDVSKEGVQLNDYFRKLLRFSIC